MQRKFICWVANDNRRGTNGNQVKKKLVGLLSNSILFVFTATIIWAAPQKNCRNELAIQTFLGKAYEPTNSYTGRRIAFEKAIVLCPSTPDLYDAYSVFLLKHHDYQAALTWIRRGLLANPGNQSLNLDLAIALLSIGRTKNALAILNKLPGGPKVDFYKGMAFRDLANHEAARQAFVDAIRHGNNDPYVYYVLVEQDRLLGDKKAGLKDFKAFYERFPNSPFSHMLLGDAELSVDKNHQAEIEFRKALHQDPGLPTVHFKLGYLEFKRGKYLEAAELFRKEIELSPGLGESYLYLGACLHRMGDDDKAIPLLEQAIYRDPRSVLAYRELVAAEEDGGRVEAALQTLKKATKLFPNDQALHAQLAQLLTKLGRSVAASKEVQLAERSSKSSIEQDERSLRLMKSGKSYQNVPRTLSAGMPATSSAMLGKTTGPMKPTLRAQGPENRRSTQTPNGLDALLDTAHQCLERSDARCAEEALGKVHDPVVRESEEFLELKAHLLAIQHKYREALAAITLAIQKDPGQPGHLLFQGKLYQKVGDQVSAIRSFLECEKLDQQSPLPVYLVGTSFFALAYYSGKSADYDRAARHFRLALELDPRFSKADFMLGVISMNQYLFAQAKPYLKKAVQLDPKNAYYHLHYGALLSRLGDNSEALHEMELAKHLDPKYALVHYGLGNVYVRLGKLDEARKELEIAVGLDPHLARAFYLLGSVYRTLGQSAKSKEAYAKFQSAKEQVEDPVEATISSTGVPLGTRRRQSTILNKSP